MCLVEHFPKIVNGHKPFGAFSKSCFIDVWQGPKYATCLLLEQLLFQLFYSNCTTVMVQISFDFKEKLANKLNDQLLNNNAKLVFLILRDTRAHEGVQKC